MTPRASLDYIEEVPRSRIVGIRSTRIGYEIGSSLAGVYTTSKTFSREPQAWTKNNNMIGNMAMLFAWGTFRWSSFLDNLKPLDKKLGIWRTPNMRHCL